MCVKAQQHTSPFTRAARPSSVFLPQQRFGQLWNENCYYCEKSNSAENLIWSNNDSPSVHHTAPQQVLIPFLAKRWHFLFFLAQWKQEGCCRGQTDCCVTEKLQVQTLTVHVSINLKCPRARLSTLPTHFIVRHSGLPWITSCKSCNNFFFFCDIM